MHLKYFLFLLFLALPDSQLSVASAPNILFRFQITFLAGPPHMVYFQSTRTVSFMQHLQMKIIPMDIIKMPGLL